MTGNKKSVYEVRRSNKCKYKKEKSLLTNWDVQNPTPFSNT